MEMTDTMKVLQGKGVVPGVVIGRIRLTSQDISGYLAQYVARNPAAEAEKLEQALLTAQQDLETVITRAREAGEEKQAEIMGAHVMMVGDPELKNSVLGKIAEGLAAPRAMLDASEEFAMIFAAMDNEYMQERAADVRDIGRRVAKLLLGIVDTVEGDEPLILCGAEIEPSAIANLPPAMVQGVIMGQGGTTSHAVIIAKSRGLATVVGLSEYLGSLKDGDEVVLDGDKGQVILGADTASLANYRARAEAGREQRRRDLAIASLPAVTTDGVRVQLAANVGIPQDMQAAMPFGCEGVGLYRTEFLFMGRDTVPGEEEQFKAYREVVEQCGEHLCVIRTMDIGGDKPLPYLEIPREDNPFLGWRAIRISLVRTDLFMTQLRAILRASAFGKIAIMLPMVISSGEIRQARQHLQAAMRQLEQEQIAFDRNIQFGIMVETPAAAVMTPQLAKECDFFSIGTNDLVQYTLAVDRVNPNVSSLYSHYHPAVLRLIRQTITAAREQGIWSGMCGEMAGDPLAAVLLLGMGIHELSMSGPAIPRVKEMIRSIDSGRARQLLDQALELDDAAAVKELLLKELGN
ncbi:MAG TPA: phosphoenolpyruvate--protein phosphotransferase [Patescibacteria group bacterium]|nr:phosphoenolpyruvate--protein phosphotransferase [Patescibacteria group bacterium]